MLATRKSVDPYMSGRHTCRFVSEAVALWASAAKVLTLKSRVPGSCVAAPHQERSCGSQADHLTGLRTCWLTASTSVMEGVWACSS